MAYNGNIANPTSTGAVRTTSGYLHFVSILGGADAATIKVYDNASAASGNLLAELGVDAGKSDWIDLRGFAFVKGLYATITGTTPAVTIICE